LGPAPGAAERFWRSAAFIGMARLCGCAHVVQLYGGRLERLREHSLRSRLLGAALDRAACVIAPTGRLRAAIARLTSNERVTCIPCPAPALAVDAYSTPAAASQRPP